MKRLCFISRFASSLLYPDLEPMHGGAETQCYLNSRELAKDPDLDVHLILQGKPLPNPDIIDNVRIHPFPFKTGWIARARFQSLLKSINADIHIQQGISSTTKEVAFYCQWRRSRFIYWIASNRDVDWSIPAGNLKRNKMFEWGMLKANRIIAQTKWQADKLNKTYSRPCTVIANGFPPCKTPPDAPRKHILWAGRFIPVKRPELLIRIAAKIPDEHFIMLAPLTNESASSHLEEHMSHISGTSNIEFHPGVSLKQVENYMRSAKLFLNTSKFEGFPNTFVQAMRASTPIASLSFDPDNIIRLNKLGIPPADDMEEFIRNIKSLLADPVRLNAYGRNVAIHANRHHDLSGNMEQFKQVIHDIS